MNNSQMKIGERKKWEREQRRARIVDRAQELFFQKGYDAVTIDEIAAAAGYSKRSIYIYFRDREEIFLAVVSRGQAILLNLLKTAMENHSSSCMLIESLGRAFYDFSINHSEFFSMLMLYESRIHVYHADPVFAEEDSARSLCQGLSNRYGELVILAIGEDMIGKRISSKLEPKQLMMILWGQIFGVMQIILMRKSLFMDAYGITHEKLFEEFMDMIRRSLAPYFPGKTGPE